MIPYLDISIKCTVAVTVPGLHHVQTTKNFFATWLLPIPGSDPPNPDEFLGTINKQLLHEQFPIWVRDLIDDTDRSGHSETSYPKVYVQMEVRGGIQNTQIRQNMLCDYNLLISPYEVVRDALFDTRAHEVQCIVSELEYQLIKKKDRPHLKGFVQDLLQQWHEAETESIDKLMINALLETDNDTFYLYSWV